VLIVGYVIWRLIRHGRTGGPQEASAPEGTPEAFDDMEAEESLETGEGLEAEVVLEATEGPGPQTSLGPGNAQSE
jgi:hypothetical protein